MLGTKWGRATSDQYVCILFLLIWDPDIVVLPCQQCTLEMVPGVLPDQMSGRKCTARRRPLHVCRG